MSETGERCGYDVFVIGGGINGLGIARGATGRGYSVCLAEQDDLAPVHLAEWGVRVHADEAAWRGLVEEQDANVARISEQMAASTAGKAYLLRRKKESAIQAALQQTIADLGTQCHGELSSIAHANDRLATRPQPEEEGLMILNGSYLVGHDRQADFHAQVEALGARSGFTAVLTGPWPPYSFVELEADDDHR